MADTAAFAAVARETAERFLHTVLVVDDEALGRAARPAVEPDDTPGHRGVVAQVDGEALVEPEEEPEMLETGELLRAFALRGIVCGLLDADHEAGLEEAFLRAAQRADLIVLDWVIGGKTGDTARSFLGGIREADANELGRRLRAVAIYTGTDDLYSIADAIAKDLKSEPGDEEVVGHDDGLAFRKGPLHVAVYAKPHAQPEGDAAKRRVSAKELPERLIEDFSCLTRGLVPNVALQALSALRTDTHRILEVLGAQLDIGYLGHRSALPDAVDSQGHLVDMVTSEIRAVLDDHDVGNAADYDRIVAWLADPKYKAKWGERLSGKLMSVAQVRLMLQTGIGSDDAARAVSEATANHVSISHLTKAVRKQAHRVFSDDDATSDQSDAEFARRMTLRTHYERPVRTLQLGSIVLVGDQYLLCVQPLCDSVRLSGKSATVFPFLALQSVKADEGARFVIYDRLKGDYVRLASPGKPSSIATGAFRAGKNGRVTASKAGEGYAFEDVDGRSHIWMGELKPEVGRDVAVQLAEQFARQGVDEPEILRLSRR